MKHLINIIKRHYGTIKYEIGFIDLHELSKHTDNVSDYVHWLREPLKNTKSWFADPFILSIKENKLQVLAEEYVYKDKKGIISLLDIEIKDGEYYLIQSTPILTLDTHLSFPYIFQENGDTYLCPENYQSGGVSMYKLSTSSPQLEFVNQIIDDPLVDTQIFKYNDTYYAMGVKTITEDLSESRFLSIYSSKELCGKYKLIQTITNDKNEERGAGQIWVENDYYVRPAQSCEGGYGRMIILYRIEVIDGAIEEKEMYRYKPNIKKKNGLALHTFNKKDNLCVVDGNDYRYVPIFITRNIFPFIDKLLHLFISNTR